MPFTPFHLGPALSLGLLFRKYIHAPTFIIGNVLVDIEPFLVLFIRLNSPLHGYLHSFVLAFLLGTGLGLTMFFLERFLQPFHRLLLLEPDRKLGVEAFVVAGASGTMFHVLLDSPLYSDIRPFYPLSLNPMHKTVSSLQIYTGTMLAGILGIVFYAVMLFRTLNKLRENKEEQTLRQ